MKLSLVQCIFIKKMKLQHAQLPQYYKVYNRTHINYIILSIIIIILVNISMPADRKIKNILYRVRFN